MNIIGNDQVICYDVDDTLVIWDIPPGKEHEAIEFDNFGVKVWLLPHKKHLEMLKNSKARGHHVVVWSQGGFSWASEVVRVLGIENYVDIVMTKPKWMVDDIKPNEWTTHFYFKPESNQTPDFED